MTIDREKLIHETAQSLTKQMPYAVAKEAVTATLAVIEPILAATDKMRGALLTYKCSYDPHHGQIVREAVDKALAAYEQATGKETMWPDPKRYHDVTTHLLAECQRHGVNAIAGYDYLGYHLAAGVCSQSWPEYPIPALLIRDGEKGHGAKELVAGPRLEADARVAVILTEPEGLPIAIERLCAVGYDPCVALNWEAIEAGKYSDTALPEEHHG